jgi:hypothetical protein
MRVGYGLLRHKAGTVQSQTGHASQEPPALPEVGVSGWLVERSAHVQGHVYLAAAGRDCLVRRLESQSERVRCLAR